MAKFTAKQIDKALDKLQVKLIDNTIKKSEFDMSNGMKETCTVRGKCGSVGCIGGWLFSILCPKSKIYEQDQFVYAAKQPEYNWVSPKLAVRLGSLFFPSGDMKDGSDYGDLSWSNITKREAVRAIQNFRDGAANPWAGVK